MMWCHIEVVSSNQPKEMGIGTNFDDAAGRKNHMQRTYLMQMQDKNVSKGVDTRKF